MIMIVRECYYLRPANSPIPARRRRRKRSSGRRMFESTSLAVCISGSSLISIGQRFVVAVANIGTEMMLMICRATLRFPVESQLKLASNVCCLIKQNSHLPSSVLAIRLFESVGMLFALRLLSGKDGKTQRSVYRDRWQWDVESIMISGDV